MIATVVLALGTELALAQSAASPQWAEGADLARKLAAPLSGSWQGLPLARALEGLSRSQNVAILRDRRVDPDQSLRLVIDNVALSAAFEQIAEDLALGYSQFGPVAYLGPQATARQLRTIAALRTEEARQLPADRAKKLLAGRTWQWHDLAEPRELAQQLAQEAGVELAGVEQLPHDLWPQTELPALTWVERLTLLAAQFDLTFELSADGRTVRLVPLREDATLARTYPVGPHAAVLAQRWAQDVPEAAIDVEGEQIRVSGRVEDHERIAQRLNGRPARRTSVRPGQEVYQLTVDNAALDKIVEQLSQRLGLTFRWDRAATEAAGIAANQLVSINVQQADLDELLQAVFTGTGLEFQRRGHTVVVRPVRQR